MSYRNTFITNYLYLYGRDEFWVDIEKTLKKHCDSVHWHPSGKPYFGYFHGIIKGLSPDEFKDKEDSFKSIMHDLGVKVTIIYEP